MSRAGAGGAAAAGKLTLRHFMLRTEALSLYRAIWRSSSVRVAPYIPSQERSELREFARNSFQMMRGVDDVEHIKALIKGGRAQLESTLKMINLSRGV